MIPEWMDLAVQVKVVKWKIAIGPLKSTKKIVPVKEQPGIGKSSTPAANYSVTATINSYLEQGRQLVWLNTGSTQHRRETLTARKAVGAVKMYQGLQCKSNSGVIPTNTVVPS